LEFSELFQILASASAESLESLPLSLISVLFALGAITKAAQVPFHFWLPETMEAPTPVSALMHAGIINAGGFLMIRLNPLLAHSAAAHWILVVVGAITAIFGAMVMMTQNDIKKKLAYSTTSQMGIMMLCCGLGAYSLALFHIVAHSFYKAHAFLSTGELVEESKKLKHAEPHPFPLRLVGLSFVGLLAILASWFLWNGDYVAYVTYVVILLFGLNQSTHFSLRAASSSNIRFVSELILIFAVTSGVCIFIEYFLMTQLGSSESGSWNNSLGQGLACVLAYGIFVFGFWLSSVLIQQKSKFSKNLYMLIWNGGYFYPLTNRIFSKPSGVQR
jgi:NAD(P)H-quinone oxidoreductase subunit 5